MKLFSLLPRRLSHFACNSPPLPRPTHPSGPLSPAFSFYAYLIKYAQAFSVFYRIIFRIDPIFIRL